MKILYFISVHGHGRGGHFHSLNHISKEIGNEHDVKIISIGPGKSNIIESNPHFLKHLFFNGFNFLELSRELKKYQDSIKPNFFHCFDQDSYNIVRLFISTTHNKVIVNKCGGPNPRRYSYVPNLILFSQENLDWFSKQQKFKNTNIDLVPNRVKKIVINSKFQPIIKDEDKFVFIRICRVGKIYEKSILNSIYLIEYLISQKIKNIVLYVIGVVEDLDVFNELNKHKLVEKGFVIFLKEDIYTKEASKMLYLADAVIGTGRGAMESSSLGIPILGINSNNKIPVLLDESQFFSAFKTNFSERNVFSDFDEDVNLKKISKLVLNKEYYIQNSIFSKKMFDEYFNLIKVRDSYPNCYNKSINFKRKIFSDFPLILHTIFNFSRSYLNIKNR